MNLRGWARRVFLHNLPLKIMSVILATGLWYAVSREPVSEVEVSVPVEFQNVPENLELGSEHIPRAEIRVRGPARIVRDIKPSDVRAEIDLAGAQPGERTFDLSGRHIRTLRELSVVQIVPSQLHLDLDLRETRELEIRARHNHPIAQHALDPTGSMDFAMRRALGRGQISRIIQAALERRALWPRKNPHRLPVCGFS